MRVHYDSLLNNCADSKVTIVYDTLRDRKKEMVMVMIITAKTTDRRLLHSLPCIACHTHAHNLHSYL